MTTSESRNESHFRFYYSLVKKYPNEFRVAQTRASENDLMRKIVLDIGELTVLHLKGLAHCTSYEELDFTEERYTAHLESMSAFLEEVGLPRDILDIAVDFGRQSYEQEKKEDGQ